MVDTESESKGQDGEVSEEEPAVQTPQLVSDFDPDRRKLAILYTRALRKFDFQMAIVSLIIMIVLLFSKVTVLIEDFITENI